MNRKVVQAKKRSSTDPNDQGDLTGSLNDKDIPLKRTREKETPRISMGKLLSLH